MKILITGTSKWLGRYLSENLKNNHEIIWVSRNKLEIENYKHICGDIRESNTLEKIVNHEKSYDYIIINAWVWYFDKFKNLNIEENRNTIETNLLSPILLINMLLKEDKIKKWIIFIWSIAWKKSMKNWASYAASKFWLRGFAMQIKNEIKWIKTHIINPSIIKTAFHDKSKIEIVWKYKETSLEDIFQKIEEIIEWKEKRFEIDF